MPEDALLVERQPARRGEVRGDARSRRDAVVQPDASGISWLDAGHEPRERVPKPGNELEQRQVGVRVGLADQVRWTVWIDREHALEIAQELRHPLGSERGAALHGGLALLLVIAAARDRVMR